MNGLELARGYYEEYGAPMLHREFADVESLLAVGLVGSGSECLGFDDAVSTDHDFEPGFCLFLPGEDVVDRRTAFLLERAYAKLPAEYGGFKRARLAPVGGHRHGVIRTADFFTEKVGAPDGELTARDWLTLPEYALLEATGGEVFRDDLGTFTAIRRKLSLMPEDVRRKKLAGHLLIMAQAGQYNYNRCLMHGEPGAAQLAAVEFVKAAISVVFLLNRRYQPYYKWSFRALRGLTRLSQLSDALEYLLMSENGEKEAETKYLVIEDVAALVIGELQNEGLTKAVCGDLEKHAYSVNDGVDDPAIRNLHVLAAI